MKNVKRLFLNYALPCLLLMMPGYLAKAQHVVEFYIPNNQWKVVRLGSFFGERISPVDSARTNKDCLVRFTFPGSRRPGMYRLIIDKSNFTDFIYNNEDVSITVLIEGADRQVKIVKSQENEVYYEFLERGRLMKRKLDLLSPVLDYFPKDDPIFKRVEVRFEEIQQEQFDYIAKAGKQSPGLYALKLMRFQQPPFVSSKLTDTARKNYVKKHFFDKVDLADTSLLRSNAIPGKVIDYLSLYSNRELSQKELEKEFTRAVDIILPAAEKNQQVYDFVLRYLINGFDRFKFEEVLTYIYEHYLVKSSCGSEGTKDDLSNRLQAYEKLAIGKTAPEFSAVDINNKMVSDNTLTKDYRLLVFWASWCPHCNEMLPGIKTLVDGIKDPKFEVVTFSLDTNKAAWVDFVKKNAFAWRSCCDLKGWNGQVVKDYHIYATPTMFLIDRQRKILAKPITLFDLREALIDNKLMPAQ